MIARLKSFLPQPLGWGFLLAGGFIGVAIHPQVEQHFLFALVNFGMACLGYWGLTRILFQWDGKSLPPSWKSWGIYLAIGIRLTMIYTQPCDDIYRYAWEAKVERAGFSAAHLPPNHPDLVSLRDKNYALLNHSEIATVYPRVAQWFFRLGFPASPIGREDASFLRWKLILIAADLIAILGLSLYSWQAALTFGLHPLLIFEGAGRGHFESIWIALFIVAWLAMRSTKDAWFGFASALAISIKPIAVVILLPWGITSAWKRWRAYMAGLLIIFSLWDVLATTGDTLAHFVGKTQYNSLLPGLWKSFMAHGQSSVSTWESGAWMTPLSLIGFGLWFTFMHFGKGLLWTAEKILLWLFALILLTSTVFHPWYILWILPFAALQKNGFWLTYAGMQILGLWPYYRQHLGHPWQEVTGLKWFMIAIPFLFWIASQWHQKLHARSLHSQ